MTKKIKIALAEDNEKFRKAIMRWMHLENDIEVILEAENGLHLIDQLETIKPDIILLDIRMPLMNGIEAANKVKELYPCIKVIAFSQYDIEENIIEMNIHGVKSFIGKEDDPRELIKAIRIVYDGGVYMTERAAHIIQCYLSRIMGNLTISQRVNCEVEKQLIRLIVEGLTSKEIGERMHKSHRTIEEMREKLYRKFNVKNKEQLIAITSAWNLHLN